MEDAGDLEQKGLEVVDMERVYCHYDAISTVPDNHGQEPWKVRAMINNGAGVSCKLSENMPAGLGAPFEGARRIDCVYDAKNSEGEGSRRTGGCQQTANVSGKCHPVFLESTLRKMVLLAITKQVLLALWDEYLCLDRLCARCATNEKELF